MADTAIPGFTVRLALAQDVPLLLSLILELAKYEKRPQDMTATAEDLHHWMFKKQTVQALIALYDEMPAGYALFYPVFSSFKAKASMYVEDIFILPHLRGKHLGKTLFAQVAQQAIQQNMQSLKWSCLAWNQPSINFYTALGAQQEDGVHHFALSGSSLEVLAAL